MRIFVHKLAAVILTVDIQKKRAELPKLRNRHGISANTAIILTIGRYLAAYDYLVLRLKIIILEPFCGGVGFKNRRHNAVFGPGAHKLAACASAEHSTERVDNDRLTGTGFAGQNG